MEGAELAGMVQVYEPLWGWFSAMGFQVAPPFEEYWSETDATPILSDADQVIARFCPGETVIYGPGDDTVTEGGVLSPMGGVGVGGGEISGVGLTVGMAVVFFRRTTRVCEPLFPALSLAVIFILMEGAELAGMVQVYEPLWGWFSAMGFQVAPPFEEYWSETDATPILSDADQVITRFCPGDTVIYGPGDDTMTEGGVLSPMDGIGVGGGDISGEGFCTWGVWPGSELNALRQTFELA